MLFYHDPNKAFSEMLFNIQIHHATVIVSSFERTADHQNHCTHQ